MPPTARIVGLMLALAGSACVAAQTDMVGGPAKLHRDCGDGRAVNELSVEAERLKAALGPPASDVRQVGFESAMPDADRAEDADWQPPPPNAGQPADDAQSGALSRLGADTPIRLSPPGNATRKGKPGAARARNAPSPVTIAGSLGLVLGLFLVVAWVMRRTVPGDAVALPSEVVEVLGRAALAGKAQVHLVRCGGKLLLVSLSPTGVETLTEITDPDEVTRLAGLCHQAHPGSTTAAFRQVLQQFTGQPTSRELADTDDVGLANTGVRGVRGRQGRGLEGYDV